MGLVKAFFNSNKFDELKSRLRRGIYLLKLSSTRIYVYKTGDITSAQMYLTKGHKKIGFEEYFSERWRPPLLPDHVREIFLLETDTPRRGWSKNDYVYLVWINTLWGASKFYTCTKKPTESKYRVHVNDKEYSLRRVSGTPKKLWGIRDLEEAIQQEALEKIKIFGCDFYKMGDEVLNLSSDEITKVHPSQVTCLEGYLIDKEVENTIFLTAYVPTQVKWTYEDDDFYGEYVWKNMMISFPIKIENMQIKYVRGLVTCANLDHPLVYSPPNYGSVINGTNKWYEICLKTPLNLDGKRRIKEITEYTTEVIFKDLETCMREILSPRKEYLETYNDQTSNEPPAVKYLR